jgi:Uma2 family endonuclease
MSPETAAIESNQTSQIVEEVVDWQPPMPPTNLIFDDGEPLESNRHRIAMNTLIRSLQQAWAERNDFFTGGNMFVYYSSIQARNRDFKGPDFFVTLDIDGSYPRQGWVVWEENGRYPDVIVELLSETTAEVDKGIKKELYEKVFRTRNYFIFDPFNANSLQGWHLDSSFKYQPITPDSRGWLWCETLGLWLGTNHSTVDREPTLWLRFFDEAGNLVLLPEEAAHQRAEAESQRAEAESQRAEAESQRAEAESQRAEAESQRAERLAARLRELGEDVDNL